VAINAAQLYALVSVAGADTSIGQLQRVSRQVNTTQSTMGKLGANARQMATGVGQIAGGVVRIAEYGAVALGGLVVASEKTYMSFQAQMELIHTQAGQTQQEVVDQTKAVLDMAHAVGTAPEELAKGLYHIESVGVSGAAALDILKASAIGAKIGLADMESVANAVTAIKFSGIGGVKDMVDAMEQLNAIVGVGNMRMSDLMDAFGTGILGTSKTFGVNLRSMGAALAVLTDAGVKAQPAATRMQMMFTHMAAPVAGAEKILARLGLTGTQLGQDLRGPDGVFAALDDLRTHLEKAGEAKIGPDGLLVISPQGVKDVAKIFGGSRFGAAAMQLLIMADRVKAKYEKIGQQQGTFAEKWAQTTQTTRFAFSQLINDLQQGAIRFAQGFDPAIARAIGKLDAFVMSHMGDIQGAGVALGQAIDKIDWKGLWAGAQTFVDLLKGAIDLLGKIPPQFLLLGAGFLGLNKVSGGLLGAGIGNLVGGAGKGIGNLISAAFSTVLAKVPVIGGALSAATAMRVFVVNMPAGGFGGGLPGLTNIASKAGLLALLGGEGATLLSVGVMAISAVALAALADSIHGAISPGGGLQGRTETNTLLPADQLMWPFGPKNTPHIDLGPFKNILGGDSSFTLPSAPGAPPGANATGGPDDRGALNALTSQMRVADRWWADMTDATKANTATLQKADWLKKLEASWLRAGQTMHDKIKEAMAGLLGPNAKAAAVFLGAKLGNAGFGAGGYNQAEAVLAVLKAMNSRDPAFLTAMKRIEARLTRLRLDRDDLAAAEKIAQDSDPKNKKLDDLRAIMADLRAHGDKTTQAKVGDLISAVKHNKVDITVHPQPVRLFLNGREIVTGVILSTAFSRYTSTNIAT